MANYKKKEIRSLTGDFGVDFNNQLELLIHEGIVIPSGYTKLSRRPEVIAVVDRIANLIASQTIKVMENKYDENGNKIGDKKITNALTAKLDQYPNEWMTRHAFIKNLIYTLYLEGDGNAVVVVDTKRGSLTDYLNDKLTGNENYINNLIPVKPSAVTFHETKPEDKIKAPYYIKINGRKIEPSEVLHFRIGANPNFIYKGKGPSVPLSGVLSSLGAIDSIQKEYLSNAYFPSFIIKWAYTQANGGSKVGELMDELFKKWNRNRKPGDVLNIPTMQADIEQVKPMSLSDLAIKDTKELNNKTVAAMLGVPLFLIDGSVKFNRDEYNMFIKSTIVPLSQMLGQEMTNKLMVKNTQYIKLDYSPLYKYDSNEIGMYLELAKYGKLTGNELREKLNIEPSDDQTMKEFYSLENIIPNNKLQDQKKLKQNTEEEKDEEADT